ncbi:hypothetical protein D3C80_2174010 [compost metagenome]
MADATENVLCRTIYYGVVGHTVLKYALRPTTADRGAMGRAVGSDRLHAGGNAFVINHCPAID